MMHLMKVKKRDGRSEEVSFDKIMRRIYYLCDGLDQRYIDIIEICKKVILGLYDGVSTSILDNLAAETAASMATVHPDYAILAARIAVSNLHKNTSASFSETMKMLHEYVDPKTGEKAQLLADDIMDTIWANREILDNAVVHERDYDFDYFGFKTLERSYLMRLDNFIVERPQYMFLRAAVGIHKDNINSALETYELMSQKWFIHATPTLFNSGTPKPQLSSCFLLSVTEDSIPGIFETLSRCARISQSAGGIGLSIHNIRAKGSYIKGTGGTSNGIVPMLRVYNDTARYVDQGGGKRKGAFAIYIEPWHADVYDFLDLKKNHGKEEARARDLFYALWIPDLFMERVETDAEWTLMCPNECPGLFENHSEKFNELYLKYEAEGRGRQTIKARDLWLKIMESQIETGTPYMLYKDHANRKSNQKNLGTIRSSNLCTEIMEYTSKDETAVCNLGSLALPRFIKDGAFDFVKLRQYTAILTRNLNKVIDINFYPTEKCKRSNMRHRPIGIGVQGLADVFAKLRLPWTSPAAAKLNRELFENIYYAAVAESVAQARAAGGAGDGEGEWHGIPIEAPRRGAYSSFEGSPAAAGQLQFDLWEQQPRETPYLDWAYLKETVTRYGMRNSLLVAPMPTASTSQILGNNECIEPFTSNLYSRRVLAGEFVVVNKYLVDDLVARGLWTADVRSQIIANNGSVQSIAELPADLRELYRTTWEIPMKTLITLAADRAPFICQSQSLNLFLAEPTYSKLSSMHMFAWKQGLKTGCYYLRTKGAAKAQQFTVEPPACTTCSA